MGRLLTFLVAIILIQFALVWVLTHFGLIILGGCAWWMWSLWIGRNHA